MSSDWGTRVTFLEDVDVMEVNFSGVHFTDVATVNAAYDTIDSLLSATGRK